MQVENQTEQPLESVIVEVTGASYALGTLEPGEDASVRVQPSGESSVVVTASRAGEPDRVEVPVYFEAHGYSGTVEVDFQPDGAALIESDIRIGHL